MNFYKYIHIGGKTISKKYYYYSVCEAAISGPQKGFVPGRQITDLLHQVYT